MKKERLCEMANDIGDFFKAEPDQEEAINGILSHLTRFWDPRMKRQIISYLEDNDGSLNPLVFAAVTRLKAGMENAA